MTDDSSDLAPRRCPSCNAELGLTDVLCISCGYHLEKKTHLASERVDKPKRKRRRRQRYVLGFLHGGNALVLCAGAGFLLGVILAVVLGSVFGDGTTFEMGFYVFAGVVLGTAIGGAIGYVLSSVLPNASSESASEQLQGGLFRVIGGFVITGIGIFSFGYFNELEKTGGKPGTMFALPLALYELVGKWGMAVVLGGIGVAMIVLGIRAMIPRDS